MVVEIKFLWMKILIRFSIHDFNDPTAPLKIITTSFQLPDLFASVRLYRLEPLPRILGKAKILLRLHDLKYLPCNRKGCPRRIYQLKLVIHA